MRQFLRAAEAATSGKGSARKPVDVEVFWRIFEQAVKDSDNDKVYYYAALLGFLLEPRALHEYQRLALLRALSELSAEELEFLMGGGPRTSELGDPIGTYNYVYTRAQGLGLFRAEARYAPDHLESSSYLHLDHDKGATMVGIMLKQICVEAVKLRQQMEASG